MKPSALFEAPQCADRPTCAPAYLGRLRRRQVTNCRQVAQDLNWQFLDLRAVQLDPVDLRGLPRIAGDQAEWVPSRSR
jgi:hypothetical protein